MAQKKGFIVGVDLGGTSMKAIVAGRKNAILAIEKCKTPSGLKPRPMIQQIAALVKKAASNAGINVKALEAVSVGAPGPVDTRLGVVRGAANLGWKDVPLASRLKDFLGVPVVVENDVNAGIIGEHALGAGEKVRELAGIFVGTGIGGGIIHNGKLFEGHNGWAGEVGHTVVLADGPLCGCGRRGHIEALASRTAIERAIFDALKKGRQSAVPEILRERRRDRITSSVLQAALARKDPLVEEVMMRAQYYLGILLANVVNILDPERVVIGGGIAARLGETFVGPIRQAARDQYLHSEAAHRIRVLPGSLGDNAGALGAVVLARERLGI
jgi:glucokinase